MRVRTDEAADALYIRLEESAIVESEEVSPGVILDFDEGGRVVGIEILSPSAPAWSGAQAGRARDSLSVWHVAEFPS